MRKKVYLCSAKSKEYEKTVIIYIDYDGTYRLSIGV